MRRALALFIAGLGGWNLLPAHQETPRLALADRVTSAAAAAIASPAVNAATQAVSGLLIPTPAEASAPVAPADGPRVADWHWDLPIKARELRPSALTVRVVSSTSQVVPTAQARSIQQQSVPASRADLARDIQKELKRVGCYEGEVDGIWGAQSREAMARLVRNANASLPTQNPEYVLLKLVRGATSGACAKPEMASSAPAPASSVAEPAAPAALSSVRPSAAGAAETSGDARPMDKLRALLTRRQNIAHGAPPSSRPGVVASAKSELAATVARTPDATAEARARPANAMRSSAAVPSPAKADGAALAAAANEQKSAEKPAGTRHKAAKRSEAKTRVARQSLPGPMYYLGRLPRSIGDSSANRPRRSFNTRQFWAASIGSGI